MRVLYQQAFVNESGIEERYLHIINGVGYNVQSSGLQYFGMFRYLPTTQNYFTYFHFNVGGIQRVAARRKFPAGGVLSTINLALWHNLLRPDLEGA